MAVAVRGSQRLRSAAQSYIVKTLGEVAEFFGVSNQTVNGWRADSDPMPGSANCWDLAAIAKWRTTKGRQGGGLSDELKAADIRLKTAQAKAKEIENAISEGVLLDRGDVERWAATALIETREMVMALPEMLATSSPPELREFVRSESDRHCRDVLTMLRRKLEADVGSDEVSATTAEDTV